MKDRCVLAIAFLLTLAQLQTFSQKQLVLLKRENVILRLQPGDEIVFKRKGSNDIKKTYINNLSDTAVVTHRDTVPFHQIERLYFSQSKFYNVIGSALVIGGAGYFLIDQINNVIVNGEKPSLNDRVNAFSIPAVAIGIPLMLMRKKSQKLNYKYRLMMAKKGSIFYKANSKDFISPYIDN